jgi:hypothetical protein
MKKIGSATWRSRLEPRPVLGLARGGTILVLLRRLVSCGIAGA